MQDALDADLILQTHGALVRVRARRDWLRAVVRAVSPVSPGGCRVCCSQSHNGPDITSVFPPSVTAFQAVQRGVSSPGDRPRARCSPSALDRRCPLGRCVRRSALASRCPRRTCSVGPRCLRLPAERSPPATDELSIRPRCATRRRQAGASRGCFWLLPAMCWLFGGGGEGGRGDLASVQRGGLAFLGVCSCLLQAAVLRASVSLSGPGGRPRAWVRAFGGWEGAATGGGGCRVGVVVARAGGPGRGALVP